VDSVSPGSAYRAAVPEAVRPVVAQRAPAAEVVAIDGLDDLTEIDFIVPVPRSSAALAQRLGDLDRLAVVQTLSAGVDAFEGRMPDHVTLCSARGARDAPVAEWVLGALLGASTGLLHYSGRTSWDRDERLADLSEWTVLIVGMGSIGRYLSTLLAALGTTVQGVASRARDDLHGADELPQLLPAADAVVVLVPLSDATRGLISTAELAAMRDGAVLVNAARGQVVDTDALVAETASGRLRAVLDVTDPEPLPDGHPLWRAAGVLVISPHMAGDSARGERQAAELAGDQLARWCAGEPLVNVVHQGTERRT
jgi:phosphoglycerate dehydrogenase-like enzyme